MEGWCLDVARGEGYARTPHMYTYMYTERGNVCARTDTHVYVCMYTERGKMKVV